MVTASVDEDDSTLIHCGKIPFPGGNEYSCGAVLYPDEKVLRYNYNLKLGANKMPVEIKFS